MLPTVLLESYFPADLFQPAPTHLPVILSSPELIQVCLFKAGVKLLDSSSPEVSIKKEKERNGLHSQCFAIVHGSEGKHLSFACCDKVR